MTKTTEETDPETCSKCGEIGQQNRMHSEWKDENRVNSNVN